MNCTHRLLLLFALVAVFVTNLTTCALSDVATRGRETTSAKVQEILNVVITFPRASRCTQSLSSMRYQTFRLTGWYKEPKDENLKASNSNASSLSLRNTNSGAQGSLSQTSSTALLFRRSPSDATDGRHSIGLTSSSSSIRSSRRLPGLEVVGFHRNPKHP